jgi:glutathione S-transferase
MTLQTSIPPIRFYRFARSGHCHRVEWFANVIGVPLEIVEVNLGKRENRSPEFLHLNAAGQVPVIRDGDVTLSDSNAILVYLAAKYGGPRWQVDDPVFAAGLQRWFSHAAGRLVSGPAAARAHVQFNGSGDLAAKQAAAHAVLRLMDEGMHSPFLLGEELSLADVANFAYAAHAPEGGVDLDGYPALRAWIERVEATPGFIPMRRP